MSSLSVSVSSESMFGQSVCVSESVCLVIQCVSMVSRCVCTVTQCANIW